MKLYKWNYVIKVLNCSENKNVFFESECFLTSPQLATKKLANLLSKSKYGIVKFAMLNKVTNEVLLSYVK
jgi:hypothetical protein